MIDRLKKSHKSLAQVKKKNYILTETTFNDRHVFLAKPLTFMNRSGEAVIELVQKFDVSYKNLLILLDDFNLPFGKLRVRSKGSDGGHNGLASIIHELGSDDFSRLRLGVGQENITDTVKFVLSKFNKKEKKHLPDIFDQAAEACFHFVTEGITQTMNKFN